MLNTKYEIYFPKTKDTIVTGLTAKIEWKKPETFCLIIPKGLK